MPEPAPQSDNTVPAAAPLVTGQSLSQLGDFRIIREIGRGGMGVVYEAEQISLGRQVALKVLPQHVLIGSSHLQRFQLEARAAARLQHANIVPVFGVGEQDGLHYYAMRLIAGEGLDVVFSKLCASANTEPTVTLSVMHSLFAKDMVPPSESGGAIRPDEPSAPAVPTDASDAPDRESPAEASESSSERVGASRSAILDSSGNQTDAPYYRSIARIGRDVAEALAYAHSQGILHRDIKPSNLLVDVHGTVWVTDFGLAKAEGSDNITQTGDVVGTLRYMAPERFDGWSDPRSDIYSLGVTLYEMLTLRRLFEEPNRAKLIKRVVHEAPAAPRKIQRKIPRDLETIVLKAIAKEPAQRYISAKEMADDLGSFLADRPVKARRSSAAERLWRWSRRNQALAGSLAALFLALALGFAGATVLWRRAEREREIASGLFDLSETRRTEAERLRTESESRRLAAERNAQEAERQRGRAEANFGRARAAVDDYLNQINESQLRSVPGLQPLRRDLLRSALRYYEDFVKERGDDASLRAGLAAAQLRLAKIHRELGADRQATETLERAEQLYETALRERPADRGLRDGLAQCCVNMGVAEMPSDQALARFERAISLWQSLRSADPADTNYQAELANTYNLVAVVHDMRGRMAESLRGHEQSFILRRALVAAHPADPALQNALASSLNNLGVLLDRTSLEEQEKLAMFRRAVEHSRIAFAAAPEIVRYGRFLMVALRNVGASEVALGHPDQAVQAILESLEVSRRLVRENPAIPSLRRELFQDYQSLGDIHREQGREAQAVETYRQAIEFLDALPRQTGQDLYTIACFLALCARPACAPGSTASEAERALCRHHADAAVATLRQAIAAGYRNVVSVKMRDELSALRDRDDFKAIVASLESSPASPTPRQAPEHRRDDSPSPAMSFKPLNRTAPSPVQLMDDAAEPAALHAIGVAQAELGRFEEARSNLGQALAARQALSQRDPRNARYRADVASTRVAQGRLAWTSGRLAEAVGIWRDVRQLMSDDIAANPNEPVLAQQLVQTEVVMGQSYAENALWGEAAEAIGLAVKHGLSDRTLSVTRLSLLAVVRERDTLLRLVPELLDRYRKTSEPLVASGLARWCSLAPGVVPDTERIVVLAQEAPLFGHTGPARSFNLSLAEYRAGRFQDAIHHAHESLEFVKTDKAGPFEALNGSVLAMAYHRLGQHDEAKRWLARIIEIDWQAVGRWPSPASWWDRSDFLTLKREAIELVTGKPAPEDLWLHERRAGAYAQLNEPAKAEAERAAANIARSRPEALQKTGSKP